MKKLFRKFFRWVFADEQAKLIEVLTEIKKESALLTSTRGAIHRFLDTYDRKCQMCYCDGSWAVLYLKDDDVDKDMVKFINLGEASLDNMRDLLARLEENTIDIKEKPQRENFMTRVN